jgi:hypothetical protein
LSHEKGRKLKKVSIERHASLGTFTPIILATFVEAPSGEMP